MALTQTTTSRTGKHNTCHARFTLLRSWRLEQEYSIYASPHHVMETTYKRELCKLRLWKWKWFHMIKSGRNSYFSASPGPKSIHVFYCKSRYRYRYNRILTLYSKVSLSIFSSSWEKFSLNKMECLKETTVSYCFWCSQPLCSGLQCNTVFPAGSVRLFSYNCRTV